MESSAVNKAHYQHRRAENHLRYRRYDEAIECHEKAAELLEEALQSVTVPRALESLKLQRDYHIKQQDIVRSKKEQFENYKKAVENQRKRMANAFPNNEFDDQHHDNEGATLQLAIYKTMEETDSLLEILVRRQGSDSDLSSADTDDRIQLPIDTIDGSGGGESCSSSNNNTPSIGGCKHPKDEKTVIEELKTLNVQLKNLVAQLVTQLDASSRESDALRSRVKYLESERLKHVVVEQGHHNNEQTTTRNNNLKVVTDSSGGTSPYVFSPMSELSPDVVEPRSLPPLELPTFDFSSLTKQTKQS